MEAFQRTLASALGVAKEKITLIFGPPFERISSRIGHTVTNASVSSDSVSIGVVIKSECFFCNNSLEQLLAKVETPTSRPVHCWLYYFAHDLGRLY